MNRIDMRPRRLPACAHLRLRGRGEAAADVGPAGIVADAEIVREIILKLRTDGFLLGGYAVHLHPFERTLAVINQEALIIFRKI